MVKSAPIIGDVPKEFSHPYREMAAEVHYDEMRDNGTPYIVHLDEAALAVWDSLDKNRLAKSVTRALMGSIYLHDAFEAGGSRKVLGLLPKAEPDISVRRIVSRNILYLANPMKLDIEDLLDGLDRGTGLEQFIARLSKEGDISSNSRTSRAYCGWDRTIGRIRKNTIYAGFVPRSALRNATGPYAVHLELQGYVKMVAQTQMNLRERISEYFTQLCQAGGNSYACHMSAASCPA